LVWGDDKIKMVDFSKCHPIELDDLVRIGNDNDGGYVLSERQIEKTGTLLSFGINDDWTFEKGFLQKKNISIYAYDYSIKDELFVSKRSLQHHNQVDIAMIILHLLLLKRSLVKHHMRNIKQNKELLTQMNWVPDLGEQL
jgi:hypothetical protein